MKRAYDEPRETAGGGAENVVTFMDDEKNQGRTKKLTKAQRKTKRVSDNQEWKLYSRHVESGKDPNPRHTLFYKQQLPFLNTEWNDFQRSLCSPLPVTFRFGGNVPPIVEACLRKRMDQEFRAMRGYVEVNGKVISSAKSTKSEIVTPVKWCPAYQVATDSYALGKSTSLAPLSQLLKREVALGNVVRQALASMIPVLLLDVHHNHSVLDVCAAPGSKTEQILAAMQAHGQAAGLGSRCSGMVVANDADPKRIHTLRRRYARCGRPNLVLNCSRAEDLQTHISGKHQFDRIVADVPCSGDGTFRKFPHLWRLFRSRHSVELHLIQLQIALAAARMLAPGGRLVYSTCSINPMEDEAVVAALLNQCPGLELVDVRGGKGQGGELKGVLPHLISRPGLHTWLCDADVFTCGEPDEEAVKASKARLKAFTPSMHPPSPEVAARLRLERCLRIMPHDQDTGGFFVAVLQRRAGKDLEAPPSSGSSSSSSSGCESTPGRVMTEQDRVATLRSLGYNPASTLTTPASSSSSAPSPPPPLRPFLLQAGAEEEEEEAAWEVITEAGGGGG